MGYFSKFLGITAALMLMSVTVAGAAERDPLKPRVPADQMGDAKAMKNPVASSPESIAKGKALFEGKVFLQLWVKVKSGWADSEAMVRQWGYE